MAPQRLDSLAAELVVDIARHLWLGDMSSLARTNRRLHQVLESFLYLTDAQPYNQYALFWAAEHNLPTVAERALRAGSPAEPACAEPSPMRPLGKVLITHEDFAGLAEGPGGRSPLACAAAAGSTKVVALLLRHSAPLQEPQVLESVGLAASNGHVETVDVLVQYSEHAFGDNVAHVVSRAFLMAATEGQRAVLERLLEVKKGPAAVDTSTEAYRTIMLGAVAEGYDEIWELLSAARPLERMDPDSCPTLLYSLLQVPGPLRSPRSMLELSEQLISFGMNVNDQALISRLAKLAAFKDNVPLTELFLSYSKEEPRDREQILSAQSFFSSAQVMRMLLARGISRDVCERNFSRALQNRNFDIARLFLSAMGGLFRFTSETGAALMHQACEFGFPEAVQQLLLQGVSATTPGHDAGNETKRRRTFLQALMNRGREAERFEIAKMLIEAGADPAKDAEADSHWGSLLKNACEAGLASIARLLLQHGVDALETVAGNKTILHIACVYCPDVELIRDLIECGADVMARTFGGSTPLHELCLTGRRVSGCSQMSRYEVAKLLMTHGADPNATNVNGTAPLHYACLNRPNTMKSEAAQVAEALLENGADVEMGDSEMKSPLFLACCDLNHPVASVLLKHGADASVRKLHGFADHCVGAADGDMGNYAIHEMVKLLLVAGVDKAMLKQMMLPPLNQRATAYDTARVLMMRAGGVDRQTTLIFDKSRDRVRAEALAKALGLVEEEDTILDRTMLTVLSWPVDKQKNVPKLVDEDDDMFYY
ncbi:hypothetical protein PWT90_07824 [Aphanocladium album]|nr:hypothetical protein PWT90_07824 [Aphanocladium album]